MLTGVAESLTFRPPKEKNIFLNSRQRFFGLKPRIYVNYKKLGTCLCSMQRAKSQILTE